MVVDLRRLFAPKAIAVVGSARECGRVIEQNRALGFAGGLWPVHPSRATVAGERAYPKVADLPGVPDAAFLAVPAPVCAPDDGDRSRREQPPEVRPVTVAAG